MAGEETGASPLRPEGSSTRLTAGRLAERPRAPRPSEEGKAGPVLGEEGEEEEEGGVGGGRSQGSLGRPLAWLGLRRGGPVALCPPSL